MFLSFSSRSPFHYWFDPKTAKFHSIWWWARYVFLYISADKKRLQNWKTQVLIKWWYQRCTQRNFQNFTWSTFEASIIWGMSFWKQFRGKMIDYSKDLPTMTLYDFCDFKEFRRFCCNIKLNFKSNVVDHSEVTEKIGRPVFLNQGQSSHGLGRASSRNPLIPQPSHTVVEPTTCTLPC